MPITTTFDSTNSQASVEQMLKEHITDYFPKADYTLTFDQPSIDSNLRKPVIWMRFDDAKDLRVEHYRSGGVVKTALRQEWHYIVTVICPREAGGQPNVIQTASRFAYECIFKGKPALGAAGLKYAACSPFVPVLVKVEQKQWWMAAELTFEVLVEKNA